MKRLLTIIALVFSYVCVFAQTDLPGSCTAALPKLLEPDLLRDQDIQAFLKSPNWGQDNKTNSYWKVYSDRANNVTYKSPSNKSERFATLGLNDELRIAKIQDGYALVYVEQYTAAIYPKINKPVSKGWVPMNHLLLWSSCPADEKGIYHKALPLVNVDEFMKAKNNGTEKDMGKVFDNPMAKSNPKKLKASMEFYFVMKEDKESGLVLLSKRNILTGKTSQVLYGWVNKASYVSWDQRSCLEPNWTNEVAEKFAGGKVPVYFTSDLSEQCASMPLGRANNLGQEVTKYRMYPDEMRYPILANDSKNDDIYKVTAFVAPGSKDGHIQRIRTGEDKSEKERKEKAANQIRTINIIMVIDATSSMKEFYPTVQKIVQEANSYFSKETGNVVKVGVVLYRDYPDGALCTEFMPMKSPGSPELASFLQTAGRGGTRSVATSATEALYKGVELALDAQKMEYDTKNSNMMFIIGDCGNDPEDSKCLGVDELVQKAVDANMQVSAFQVYNPNDTPYKLFRENTNELVKKIVEAQYQLQKSKNIKIFWEPKPDGFEFKTNLPDEQQFFIGNTRRPKSGEKMELSKLYDIIRASYIQFNTCIEARVAAIYRDDVDVFLDDDRSASAEANLILWNKYFGEDVIKKWAQDGLITAKEGYTPKKDKASGYDYWQPVIYISSAEYTDLMGKLQPVMAAAEEGSEDRRPFVEAMKELIRTLYGDIGEGEMMKKDTKEVMRLVAGLNVKSEALSRGRTLMEIQDNQVVSQDEFSTMISDFQNKYRKLDRIKNGYKYSIKIVGDTWYWIPVQDLP